MKIENNGFDVFESGTIYSPNFEETKFTLSETPELAVIFRVELPEGDKGIETRVINEHTLAFVFLNPPKGGYGNADAYRIGHINGKELYACFHVEIMGENQGYNLTYTFLTKEVSNG